jgi:hypothetical protein
MVTSSLEDEEEDKVGAYKWHCHWLEAKQWRVSETSGWISRSSRLTVVLGSADLAGAWDKLCGDRRETGRYRMHLKSENG